MNKLQIKKYDIDYSFLISNYLDVSQWGKEYTLFQYKNITVNVSLSRIGCKTQVLVFQLSSTMDLDGNILQHDNLWRNVEYHLQNPEYTIDILQQKINAELIKELVYLEGEVIEKQPEYLTALQQEKSHLQSVRNKAEDCLDQNNIINRDIRDAYIDSQVSNHNIQYAYSYKLRQKYKTMPDMFLIVADLTNNENLKTAVLESNDFNHQYYLDLMDNIELEEIN